MDKEQALNEFLKSLRVALTNALAYPKDHPYFKECVQNFLLKSNSLLGFLNPIKIIFSPDSLYMDGHPLQSSAIYAEIARIFHLRKIKSLDIMPQVSLEEMIAFLSDISRSVKEILDAGGMGKLLAAAGIRHITVEELDYSQVLKSQGQDAKDIWAILTYDALIKKDPEKIAKLAEDFPKHVESFREKDILEDEELRRSISRFFQCLSEQDRQKARKCSAELFRSMKKFGSLLQADKLAKVKSLFTHMSEEDFAALLKEELLKDENFDALSLQLFTRIAGEENSGKITDYMIKELGTKQAVAGNPQASRTIKELLSQVDDQLVSEVYRNTLSSLVEGISFGSGLVFDRDALKKNYRVIILGLFSQEEDEKKLSVILERAADEFSEAVKARDYAYVKRILDILKEKRKKFPPDAPLFKILDQRVSDFVEKIIWEGDLSPQEEDFFAGSMVRPASTMQTYLDRIFLEQKNNPGTLKLFFRFFPSGIEPFYQAVRERSGDTDLLLRTVENLSSIKTTVGDELVRRIIGSGNVFTRLRMLNAISTLTEDDQVFLLSMLDKTDIALKKEALQVLVKKRSSALKTAADRLFGITGFMGSKNDLLIENMSLAYEAGLEECRPHIEAFSKKPFFWNRMLRHKANEILRKWHAG